jgi:hypothetical protein
MFAAGLAATAVPSRRGHNVPLAPTQNREWLRPAATNFVRQSDPPHL